MATPQDLKPVPDWVEDPEIEAPMEMDDDDVEFEEFADGESDIGETTEKEIPARDYVPLWRLIEMSREDRSLRLELADFEDYDDFDSDYSGSLSH